MFAQTVSLWRKLVGNPGLDPAVPADPKEDVDRRVWVRYPTDLETTLQHAAGDNPQLAARVRDISRGGVNLQVNRAFQPGELLTVELPGERESLAILACIVRVTLLNEGEWELGCVFARELSEEDLNGYGARRQKPAADDQRLWERFPCQVKAMCHLVGAGESPPLSAQVLNLSATGIGLLVQQAVGTGNLLSVELVPLSGKPSRTMLACVVHATHQTEGTWALGCNFIRELSEQDLRNLAA
jgi:c-di-GMP-binding flagellar brake protein YcgR